jgi:hypothetical protein
MFYEEQVVNKVKVNLKRYSMEENLHKKNLFNRLPPSVTPTIMITPDFSMQIPSENHRSRNNNKRPKNIKSNGYYKYNVRYNKHFEETST